LKSETDQWPISRRKEEEEDKEDRMRRGRRRRVSHNPFTVCISHSPALYNFNT
jgi:hypothetical protein